MAKVLVLYYSSYGHIERMAQAEAQGARSAGAEVHMKRVPELVPHKVALAANYKVEQVAPVAQIEDTRRLRRHHLRNSDTLRQHGGADEEFHRPGRRPVG